MTLKPSCRGSTTQNWIGRSQFGRNWQDGIPWNKLESWYFSLCERIVAIRDKESRSKNSKTIEKVAEYIKEHYTDPNLFVDMLSNLIGLTASYVRKLFKEEMGKSVAEYMAELRFHKNAGAFAKYRSSSQKNRRNGRLREHELLLCII